MKNIASYVISFLLLIFVLYEPTPFLIGLLSIWLLWHLLTYINCYFIAHQFHVQLEGNAQSKLNEVQQLEIKLQHRSLLPLYHAQLQMEFINELTNEKIIYPVAIAVARKDEQKLILQYKLAQCGHWIIRATEVSINKKFKKNKKNYAVNAQHDFIIYPKQFPLILQTTGQQVDVDGVTTSPSFSITQSSERFGFRDYRKGDAIKQIHWKLSAKQDELVVSEHIEEQQAILQFYVEKTMDSVQYDLLLSLLFSILTACTEKGEQANISINGVLYAASNMDGIAHALLSGQRCDQPMSGDFVALVSEEAIEQRHVLRLKSTTSQCQSPYDFTAESMETQFATLAL